MSDRLERPWEADDWDSLDSGERSRRNMAYNAARAEQTITRAGFRTVDEWQEGATQCCLECFAATGEMEPARGLDSYGDCAEDGEQVRWVMPL